MEILSDVDTICILHMRKECVCDSRTAGLIHTRTSMFAHDGLPFARELLRRAGTIVLIVVNNSFDFIWLADAFRRTLFGIRFAWRDAFKRISRETIALRHSALARQKRKSPFLVTVSCLPYTLLHK